MKTLCKKYDNHGTERYKGFCQHLIFPKNLSNYHIIVTGLDKKLLSSQCFDWFISNAHCTIYIYIYIHLSHLYVQVISSKAITKDYIYCSLYMSSLPSNLSSFLHEKVYVTYTSKQPMCKAVHILWEIAPGKLGPFKI